MSEAAAPAASKVMADFDPVKKPPKRNMFAFACASLASMTSVLLGYGTYFFSLFYTFTGRLVSGTK